MDLWEQFRDVSNHLNEALRKEQQTPAQVEQLKKDLAFLKKVVWAILKNLPPEQQEKVRETFGEL